eukprot:CAMPEP_0113456380 /NCGR_PEP_ID=MMETSP0014_2-20120614/8856_1 /TAXON_ID=2857 /ORGANISM="Nitzschia sp." /LENGTH=319 /DNA_ID=CAMNT_0000347829 /DNA_START=222 /DNA_END=1181 /DNA_ORIENTATION=+ /assembly_acc=CAM_ASM_000159
MTNMSSLMIFSLLVGCLMMSSSGTAIIQLQHAQGLEMGRPIQRFRRPLSNIGVPKQNNNNNNNINNVNNNNVSSNNGNNLPAVSAPAAGDVSSSSTVITTTKDLVQSKARKVIDVLRGGNVKAQNFLKDHPFASAVIITTVNAFCADLMTQLVLERSAGAALAWNWQRTALFGTFGFVFQGFCQYAIVNLVWERLFPGTSKRAVAFKVCGMNFVSDPMFFFPAFYLFKQILVLQAGGAGAAAAAVAEGTGRLAAVTSFVSSALSSYQQNAWQDWKNSWMVWFPGHAVTYGVMPKHKRIPWIAFLSFFYMCILSLTRGGA